MGLKIVDQVREMNARKAPDSDAAKILRIEEAAAAAFPNDMAARFDYRNTLRAQAGLAPEERKRGGVAGAYDKGFLAPALALGLGPLALGLGGGAAAGGAGAAGGAAASTAGAAGGLAPVAAGGILSKAGDFLKSNALPIATGVAGVLQQNRGNQIQADAAKMDTARWNAGAPLREAGMAGLLAPTPVDTSSLRALQGQGNPFAHVAGPPPSQGAPVEAAPLPVPVGLPPVPASGPARAPVPATGGGLAPVAAGKGRKGAFR